MLKRRKRRGRKEGYPPEITTPLGFQKESMVKTAKLLLIPLTLSIIIAFIKKFISPDWEWFIDWASDFSIALLTTFAITILGREYTRRFLRNIEEYSNLDDIPWNKLISEANDIEVSVHGWDGLFIDPAKKKNNTPTSDWMHTERAKAWIEFFRNGGTLTLLLPETPDLNKPNEYDQECTHIDLIAERTGKRRDEQIREIRDTIARAQELRRASNLSGRIHVHRLKVIRWICSIRFDDSTIILSTYDNQRTEISPRNGETNTIRRFTGPTFILDGRLFPKINEWVNELHKEDLEESP